MAIAISMKPKVIIADEPTSALDVVVQKRVIETLQDVQKELDASIILVGHDMGLMAQTVDRLGVMYAGRLAEIAPIRFDTLIKPQHPYTHVDRKPARCRRKEAIARYRWLSATTAQPAVGLCLSSALSHVF